MKFRLAGIVAGALLTMTACGGSSSGSTSMPPVSNGTARVRFADGAPELEAPINGVPQDICASASLPCYLQVDGQTVTSLFAYGSATEFLNVTAGTLSLVARDETGYAVGPLKTTPLAAGKLYTLIVIGSYPHYRVLAFEEPASPKGNAQLSLYEASPSVPSADFGSFSASSHSGFKQLGSAKLGDVVTVSLGASVSNFGGYAGHGNKPFTGGDVTLASVNTFDKHNVLPFHNALRFSLLLFDAKSGSTSGPVFGSLDR
ncbi:MAG: DUF4397 domain-containing protein [Candidatus Cybelea sp.]|jgi:hypothetical protein